tara:strand:- start:22 stop:921 length:900 start_codon:yes stop_codon:yes gene_type:complete
MTDRNKFEEMLEKLVNEDRAGAEELFHEIVVEKSRSIYESLLETDLEDTEVDEAADEDEDDEEVEETSDEEVDESDDEELDEDFNLDEFEVEAGDPADDMMADLGMGDEDGDDAMDSEEEPEELEDRVMDLEDALADLKAEFEREIGGDDDEADDMDMGDEEGEEEAPEEAPEEESFHFEATKTKSAQSAGEQMREYVEKVNGGFGAKIGGDNGANTKSTVASKNAMGGTASNLNQGKDNEAGNHAGLGDLNAKDQNGGNVNVPGGKASKSMKAQPKGHGAEKKGAGETSANTKSIIGK